MSHYTVMVIGDNVEEQLAPFNEQDEQYCEERREYIDDESIEEIKAECNIVDPLDIIAKLEDQGHYQVKKDDKGYYETFNSNPNAKWDWWVTGGRWSGMLKLKKGRTGVKGEKGLMGSCHSEGEDRVDSALKGDIDFEGMRKDAANEAKERYERFERLCGGSIPKLDYLWSEIIDQNSKFATLDIQEKRALYHNQPAKQLVNKIANETPDISKDDRDLLVWSDLENYQCTKEEYIQRYYDGAISTFAVLKDGEWYEKGEMGWFGQAHNEMSESQWEKEFNALLNSLPDDTLLTVVDCHI